MACTESEALKTAHRHQFTIRALFSAMTLVAWVLAVNHWLGSPHGWMTAMPVAIVAILILLTRRGVIIGAIVGFFMLGLLGCVLIDDWESTDPRFIKGVICLAAFGSAAGASIHALFMKRWILGGLSLCASFLAFAATLVVVTPRP